MKQFIAGLATVMTAGLASAHAADVNVNVVAGGEIRPGVYGRVEFSNAPPPVLYAQPVVVVREPGPRIVEPYYLHVPPGHAKHWSKHCHQYSACNRPVYFVRSAEYDPGYRRR